MFRNIKSPRKKNYRRRGYISSPSDFIQLFNVILVRKIFIRQGCNALIVEITGVTITQDIDKISLEPLFKEADKNKNGFVTKTEIVELFKEFDTDNDGKLSEAERKEISLNYPESKSHKHSVDTVYPDKDGRIKYGKMQVSSDEDVKAMPNVYGIDK